MEVQLSLIRGRVELSGELVGPIDQQLIVRYEVIGHTADRDTDFSMEDGAVTFEINELTKNISLQVSNFV